MVGTYNFGNIRTNPANDWLGRTTAPGAAFETFDTPENSVRAVSKLLQTYGGRGADTLESIIARYSPPNENRTADLVRAASRTTGYAPGQRLDLSDPAVLNTVTRAVIRQEVGPAGPGDDVVRRGVNAALPQKENGMPGAGNVARGPWAGAYYDDTELRARIDLDTTLACSLRSPSAASCRRR